jgi:uridine kinase
VRSIVAIDGIDGSGKTVLAQRLVAEHEARSIGCVLIGVDDFRRPITWDQAGRSEADVYYDDYYDLAALNRCLDEFVGGAAALSVPSWDPVAEKVVGRRTVRCYETAVLVVEGVFALRLARVAEALVIYLQSSFAEAARRIVERDMGKGRARVEVERRIRERYAPSQARYRRDFVPERRADVLIDNEAVARPVLLRCELGRAPQKLHDALRAALGELG